VLEAQAYVHELVSSDVSKSTFTQNTISTVEHYYCICTPFILYRLSSELQIISSLHTHMNNELAKYLCTYITG